MRTGGILGRILRHSRPLINIISDQSGDVKAGTFKFKQISSFVARLLPPLGSNAQPCAMWDHVTG
jgi:hypothetical protein